MNDLGCFKAGELVEEPSATGVHEQSMTLHLKKFECSHLLVGLQGTDRVVGEECFAGFLGAIEDHSNIVVATGPGIADIFFHSRLEDGSEFIAQPVERRSQ